MTRCLCCGKPLTAASAGGWHKACIRRFFGTAELPDLMISPEVLEALTRESTNRGLTVPGVQKKLSLTLSHEGRSRLTLLDYPTGYILKPQAEEYRALPEMEFLVMTMAEATGIRTVPHALLTMEDGSFAYITRRVDRMDGQMPAMEDFCQLDRRLTEDKYKGSYERCAKIIREYAWAANYDLAELFLRLVFCFVTGNSDMHLKNFSLLESAEGSGQYGLSPAYDLLAVNVVSADTEEFALSMNGKKTHLRKKDFLLFAENAGIPGTAAQRMMRKVLSMKAKYEEMIADSYIPEDMKEALAALMRERMAVLE